MPTIIAATQARTWPVLCGIGFGCVMASQHTTLGQDQFDVARYKQTAWLIIAAGSDGGDTNWALTSSGYIACFPCKHDPKLT